MWQKGSDEPQYNTFNTIFYFVRIPIADWWSQLTSLKCGWHWPTLFVFDIPAMKKPALLRELSLWYSSYRLMPAFGFFQWNGYRASISHLEEKCFVGHYLHVFNQPVPGWDLKFSNALSNRFQPFKEDLNAFTPYQGIGNLLIQFLCRRFLLLSCRDRLSATWQPGVNLA